MFSKTRNKDRGFTLIELLVAMAISMLAAGILIANYTKYNTSQQLKQAALTLKNNLRLAQTKATSSQKPSGSCSELVGYQVSFSSNSYRMQAECTEGAVGETLSFSLPSGVTISSPPSPIIFQVLTRGIESDVTIDLVNATKTYAIGLTRGGDINDLGFQ